MQFVDDQFDISWRRVQQLAKTYRETDEIPELETPGRKRYADYRRSSTSGSSSSTNGTNRGATVLAKLLRIRDEITVDNNTVHVILQEYEHVTEEPEQTGPKAAVGAVGTGVLAGDRPHD